MAEPVYYQLDLHCAAWKWIPSSLLMVCSEVVLCFLDSRWTVGKRVWRDSVTQGSALKYN